VKDAAQLVRPRDLDVVEPRLQAAPGDERLGDEQVAGGEVEGRGRRERRDRRRVQHDADVRALEYALELVAG
jgi:hypothetical protein